MSTFSASIQADINNFEANIGKATQSIDKFSQNVGQKLEKVGDSFVSIGKKASVLSATLIAVGFSSFKMAADLEDAIGASDQIFKNSSKEIQKWAKNLSAQYGIAETEGLTLANTMGAMLKNIGKLSESEASKQAARLVELSGDLAAMFGGTSQDAARALIGALKGNNTMLDNYGMGVNDATVKIRAFELGLMDAKGEMSLQVKQAATLSLIMEQSADSLGQAGREAEGGSGSMRILTTTIKNLSTSLGEILLPIITPLITKVGDFVQKINDLDPKMKKIIVSIGLVGVAVGPMMLALGGLLKLLPLIGAGFTAMTGPVGIAVGAIVAGAVLIIKNWDAIKEYFTNGGGSEMFENVKSLALNLWESLKSIFTNIRDVVMDVWERMGSGIVKSFQRSFDIVISIISFVAETFDNFLNIFRDQSVGEALEKMKVFFVDAFNGIKDIVLKTIAQMTQGVANFFRFLGLNSLADTMEKWADSLVPIVDKTKQQGEEQSKTNVETKKAIVLTDELSNSLDNLFKKDIIPKGSLKELSEKLKVLYEELDNETTQSGRVKISRLIADLENQVARIKVNIKFELDNKNLANDSGFELKPLIEKEYKDLSEMKDKFDKEVAEIAQGVQFFDNMLVGGFVNIFEGLGSAIAGGGNILGSFSKTIIGTLGDMAVKVGTLVIGFGNAAKALHAAFTSVFGAAGAVVAGGALIVLGTAVKASISGAMSGGGGSSSGGASSTFRGGYEYNNLGQSEMKGAYATQDTVTFEIKGDTLVGILEKQSSKNNRLR